MAKKIEKTIKNYRIIIEPDKRIASGKACFTARCPTLGLAADGENVEETLKNIKGLIEFHLKCLADEGLEIPIDNVSEEVISTHIGVSFPKNGKLFGFV